ncbi:MAG: hypothetical protein AB7O59_22955 [Pirellulales bacterium]
MHASVADTTREAIQVLIDREGGRPVDIPKQWRSGPLCPKCQAAWSAAIGLRQHFAAGG